MASVSKEDIGGLNCDDLVEFLKDKFNFSDEVLSKFKGMIYYE